MEKDVAVRPIQEMHLGYRIRCLKVLNYTKSICVGGDSDRLSIHRVDREACPKVAELDLSGIYGSEESGGSVFDAGSGKWMLRDGEPSAVGSGSRASCMLGIVTGNSSASTAAAGSLDDYSRRRVGPSNIVTCLDHADTNLDSSVVFARHRGQLNGWDVRCPTVFVTYLYLLGYCVYAAF